MYMSVGNNYAFKDTKENEVILIHVRLTKHGKYNISQRVTMKLCIDSNEYR